MPDTDFPRPAAHLARLYQAETALLSLRDRQRALHYALAAFLVRHGHHAADDLTLHCESAACLLSLDGVRDELAAIRRGLSRQPSVLEVLP